MALRRNPRLVVIFAAVLAVGAVLAYGWLTRSGSPEAMRAAASAAIREHCMECHSAAERAGDLALEPNAVAQAGAAAETWEKVVRKLASRAMPPPDGPQPDEATYELLQTYLETELDAHAAARPVAGNVPQLHRLTRTEYRNAIRDLLAIEHLPAELDYELLLPADNSSSGFDNIAELLFVSPPILERYIDAATKISRLAVGDVSAPPLVNRHRMSLQLPQDAHVAGLPVGTRGGLLIETYLPLDAEYDFTIEFAGRAREAHELEILLDGERKGLARIEPGTGLPPPLALRIPAKAGPAAIGVTFVERSEAFDESTLRVRRRSRGELLAIEQVTIAGPYAATGSGRTPSRDRLFICTPGPEHAEADCAREILTTLAQRAFRRPVSNADLERLLPFYAAGRARAGFEAGIESALERVLISPQFLYRIEQQPSGLTPGTAFPLSDLELASRLSFFIWSSIPDDELLAVAATGRLRSPGVLAAQVQRLLADPRADALVSNFAAQWLFVRDVTVQNADLYLFRDYDDTLKAAFERELELFVGSIFRANASVLDLLTANHTFVNERLAEHYGIPNVVGSHFRRVTLPRDSPRAGLLGKGALLTVTSYSNRTSPVLRGKYVLENLLAAPPPAPPPNVPSLVTEDAADGAALSMREALARHRADPACASCHVHMDALGFALENFDAVGQWRERDAGAPVDATSVLPDGTRVEGVVGLRQYLADHPEQFVRAFTEKLFMYAIGRNVQYFDAPAVRAIVRDVREDHYSLAAIVTGIALSVPFQMRTAAAEGER